MKFKEYVEMLVKYLEDNPQYADFQAVSIRVDKDEGEDEFEEGYFKYIQFDYKGDLPAPCFIEEPCEDSMLISFDLEEHEPNAIDI